MEYHIWCDESDKKGELFSNFYGGAIVAGNHMPEVIDIINSKKQALNLYGEVKWSKVTENYLDKYADLMTTFFQLMSRGLVKTRIMFRSNTNVPVGLSKEQIENEYFLLYYQFIAKAFGLTEAPIQSYRASLRINCDLLPDEREKVARFKSYLFGGINANINYRNMFLPMDNISEVDSHDHPVLQCVDIITGAMSFRLNKKHLVKPLGKRRRGKKTVAKEKLYKHINREIQKLYPDKLFNIGVSTGWYEGKESLWQMPYRHWSFVPTNHVVVPRR